MVYTCMYVVGVTSTSSLLGRKWLAIIISTTRTDACIFNAFLLSPTHLTALSLFILYILHMHAHTFHLYSQLHSYTHFPSADKYFLETLLRSTSYHVAELAIKVI